VSNVEACEVCGSRLEFGTGTDHPNEPEDSFSIARSHSRATDDGFAFQRICGRCASAMMEEELDAAHAERGELPRRPDRR
jgi:hypothetical protein